VFRNPYNLRDPRSLEYEEEYFSLEEKDITI